MNKQIEQIFFPIAFFALFFYRHLSHLYADALRKLPLTFQRRVQQNTNKY